MKDLYYIWSIEHNAWWRANRRGYTQDFKQAGIYSLDESDQIIKDANQFSEDINEISISIFNECMIKEIDKLLKQENNVKTKRNKIKNCIKRYHSATNS